MSLGLAAQAPLRAQSGGLCAGQSILSKYSEGKQTRTNKTVLEREAKSLTDNAPDCPHGYVLTGLLLGDNKNPAGAQAAFTKAIEKDPNFADAFTYRALTRGDLGDIDGALRDADAATRLDDKAAMA